MDRHADKDINVTEPVRFRITDRTSAHRSRPQRGQRHNLGGPGNVDSARAQCAMCSVVQSPVESLWIHCRQTVRRLFESCSKSVHNLRKPRGFLAVLHNEA